MELTPDQWTEARGNSTPTSGPNGVQGAQTRAVSRASEGNANNALANIGIPFDDWSASQAMETEDGAVFYEF